MPKEPADYVHISTSGKVVECFADDRACPRGPENHFPNTYKGRLAAQTKINSDEKAEENRLEMEHGLFPDLVTGNSKSESSSSWVKNSIEKSNKYGGDDGNDRIHSIEDDDIFCRHRCTCGDCYKYSDGQNDCDSKCKCKVGKCNCVCCCWAVPAIRYSDDYDWYEVPSILDTERDDDWPNDILGLDLNRWRHILARHAFGADQGVDEFPENFPIAEAISSIIVKNKRIYPENEGTFGEIWLFGRYEGVIVKVVLAPDDEREPGKDMKFTVTAHPVKKFPEQKEETSWISKNH